MSTDTRTTTRPVDILLIAGLWLPATAWDPVTDRLTALGHRVHPVRLPGVDDAGTAATLDDQLDAVLSVVDAAAGPVVVVGHSAACTLAWLAADRRPEVVTRTVLIGGMPTADGGTYAAFFDIVDGVMPFPGWGPFEGPDIADLDAPTRAALAATTVPVPAGVAQGVVHLTDEHRYRVPTTMICPEYSPAEAQAWIDGGDIPELAAADDVTLIDIDSGHWPMASAPAVLAELIDRIVAEQ